MDNLCDKLEKLSEEELNELAQSISEFENVGPTVDEYFSQFKVCIFPDFAIDQLKELIEFYRKNNPNMPQAAKDNLDDLEKNLDTAINYNEFKK